MTRPVYTKPARPVYKQPRPNFTPTPCAEWSGSFEKWSRNWVRDNHWRVNEVLPTTEDALQECAMLFAMCLDRYPHVDNPKWMMGIFKKVVCTKWIKMAEKSTLERGIIAPETDITEEQFALAYLGTYHNDGPFVCAFGQLSTDAREAINCLLEAPSELIDFIFQSPSFALPPRIEWNRRLRQLFGIRSKADILAELEELAGIYSEAKPK